MSEEAPDGVGIPDGYQRLWTPHRMAYIRGEGKPTGSDADIEGCPFCEIPKLDDVDGLVVARGQTMYVVMNKFPYNSGHLLVVPYRHVPDYTDIDEEEVAEMGSLTQQAMRVLRATSGAHGFNVGMNLGQTAGAGIAGHLHQHLVPRWGGDANFMPIIGRTKTLPELLADTRDELSAAWERY